MSGYSLERTKIRPEHLSRAAFIYVRQSSPKQVRENLESQRRQYGFAEQAVALGWSEQQLVIVDEDQARSGAIPWARSGFARLVGAVARAEVGIVLSLELSRLSRNDPDWHHLVHLCRWTTTLIADEQRSMVAHSCGSHTYYHCAANIDPVSACRPSRCPAPQVYAPDLDRLVWQEIESLLSSPELMKNAWQQQRHSGGLRNPDVVEAELERLDERIRKGERQIRRLVDGYQAGFLSAAELGTRRVRVEHEMESWTDDRNRLEAEKPRWREVKVISENLSRFCESAARCSSSDQSRKLGLGCPAVA